MATVTAKSGQFTAGKMGKGRFLWRNRRNLARVRIIRKISSLVGVALSLQWPELAGLVHKRRREVLLQYWCANLPIHYQGVQH